MKNNLYLGRHNDKNAIMFGNLTKDNKGSMNQSFPLAYATFQRKFGELAPGYIVFCRRMARFTNTCSNKRYDNGIVNLLKMNMRK